MKTKLHFLLLLLFIKTLTPHLANAQLVYIPDPAFRAYLNQNFSTCMVGDSIDPACPDVLNAGVLDLSGLGISDLTGIQVFVNDSILDIEGNSLTSLPVLPTNLKTLYCINNQITSINTLPPSLLNLECWLNPLATITSLPSTLENLICHSTLLTSLPSLPSTLKNLDCNHCLLSTLPTLPASLIYLNCWANQITTLPALPNALTNINCADNLIGSIPALPTSLLILNCQDNQLSTLPALPTSLSTLNCSQNQINAIPSLPSSLQILNCEINQLTTLPALSNLEFLNCSQNQITNLPALPSTLASLNCYANQLTALPSLPSSLSSLNCTLNQITSLPVLPTNLQQLNCQNNLLTSLPELSDSLKYLTCQSNPLLCLPSLKNLTFIDFSSTSVNCVPSYSSTIFSTPALSSLPLCDIFNSNGCEVFWNIEGTVYFDADSNCILNTSELPLKNQKIILYNNGVQSQQTFTDSNGNFSLDTYTYGNYKTEIDTSVFFFDILCPSSGYYLDTISAIDSMKYDRDFAIKCKGVDLAVTNIGFVSPQPGHIRYVSVMAGDYAEFFGGHCASGVSGTVNITITGPATFNSPAVGALTPTQVLGNVITYTVPDFGLISFFNAFNFNLLVDTTATAGSQICIQVSISTSSPEVDYNNNLLSFCTTVVASYDPNDKSVYPSTTLDISGDRWLNYTIRFQNTGTAPAEHIYITDTLSTALDWSTFSLLSYSHQPLTQVYNDGLVKFSFPHINLPDSNSNEPASHGYVQFKIRANNGLTVGSTIENTANIFFDFNAPVITNTTANTVINCNIPPTVINASICSGDSYLLNNVQYYNTGVYTQRLTTSVGCDSLIELHLSTTTFNNTISQNSGTLQTSQTGTGYQWINCTTNTAISGATGQTYTPTQSGNYAVVVTDGICSDTSNCVFFSGTGIGEFNAGVTLLSSINEETNSIRVTINGLSTGGNVSITDMRGKIIFSELIPADGNKNRQLFFPAATLARGMYLIQLSGENVRMTTKVVR